MYIAYVNLSGDTIIPYGKYKYIDTDTLEHYAHVAMRTEGYHDKSVAIHNMDNTLYDIFIYDNGTDNFSEGLIRGMRNGKMGFANKYGQIVIPCVYDFANYFKDGLA